MRISQLWRYPVKSMGGERLERAWLALGGIPGDCHDRWSSHASVSGGIADALALGAKQ